MSSAAAPGCDRPGRATTGSTAPDAARACAGLPVCRLWANGWMRSCHNARAFSTSSPALPELSSQTSATARRRSSVAWALMRARASSSLNPRCSMRRRTRVSTSAWTITTSGNIGAIWDSTSNGMSSTITGFLSASRARSMSSERRCATSGCTMPFSMARFSSSLKAIAASAGRFSAPSGSRMPSPNASTRFANPSVPGSTTSRAITSPSTTIAPSSLNVADTVDLPAPIPPVNPIRNTAQVCQEQGSCGRRVDLSSHAMANRMLVKRPSRLGRLDHHVPAATRAVLAATIHDVTPAETSPAESEVES